MTQFPPSAARHLSGGKLQRARGILASILSENIVRFWYPGAIDQANGGYRLNHDCEGTWRGDAEKFLVTQARTLWFFSRLANTEFGGRPYLEAAHHGYKFLRDRMWDLQCGGFYWATGSTGRPATKPNKHLYGQACAIYALTEYAGAAHVPEALALAAKLVELLEEHSYDRQHGGYREFLLRDWRPAPANMYGYLGARPDLKLANTHLHLMEALSKYYRLTRDGKMRDRLVELILINASAVARKEAGACTQHHQRDWTPESGGPKPRVSYGHDLKSIWLLLESAGAAGLSSAPLLDLSKTFFEYALRHGFDSKRGGFYESGPLGAPADRRDKIWWVQAEALLSTLYLYGLTLDPQYLTWFFRILTWIVNGQVDWKNGEWHARVDGSGTPSGDKADAWKGPYHTGRAMIECMELLARLPSGVFRGAKGPPSSHTYAPGIPRAGDAVSLGRDS